jgi:drug/metabolite transporter (DMT)-like permease
MRTSSDKVGSSRLSMLAANYVICALLGAIYADFNIFPTAESGIGTTAVLGTINGFLYLASFILLQVNTEKNGVVLSSLFMKLGLLVPMLLSVIFFAEIPTPVQIVGFIIAIGAIILINLQSKTKGFGIGLILLTLLGGGAEAMAKVYEHMGTAALSDTFLFYTFGIALLLCIALIIIKKERPSLRALGFGALIGIPNFFSTKFLLGALSDLPAVVVYPSSNVGTILVVTLGGILIFKERLSKAQWIGLGAIVMALVLLNI